MSFLDKLRGNSYTKNLKKFQPIVGQINAFENAVKALSNEELKGKTEEFRKRLQDLVVSNNVTTEELSDLDKKEIREAENKVLEEILPEAFAVVREAARRTLGQRHFDVQLLGGMVLNSGAIAEMRTGEGKTLVATLPAYLNALTGRGVHIVTVNDYLSRRDAVWMGQIYNFLGLTVGVINHEASFVYNPETLSTPVGETISPKGSGDIPSNTLDKERDELGAFKVVHEFLKPVTRHEAYMADITYGTNNEFGFDYLRDNLEYSPERLRQRDFNYAIVDEIDSILIDEARTPLIISAPTRDAEGTYKKFASLVTSFKAEEDYIVEEKHHSISLTAVGITKAEKALGIENIYTEKGIKSVHHLETAIKAVALYHKDKEYVVKENQIVIVDEFTGRLQPGRRWSDGLHQAIEAKEGVSIQQESRTYASITFQNFFRMYPKLSGMTGTAVTSSEEFFKVYGLDVSTVPTNVLAIRKDENDQIFRTEVGKFKAIARKVQELHAKGQPVLIGTVSIEKNEVLSQFLKAEGIPHEILNAKNHEREGEIIAQAGKKGGVTIATNMAGRGVDIKLGGNPNTPELYEEIKSLGGLFVLGTERHEARRIDNQLRGRSGRQGDPGETQFFVSLEDTLMRVFASDTLKSMMGRLNIPEDEAIEHKFISKALESAQEKIEGFNFDSRKQVLEFDDVINHQRGSIYGRRRKLLMGNVDEVEKGLESIIGVGMKYESGNVNNTEEKDASLIQDDQSNIQSIISKKISEYGREPFLQAVRIVLLQAIDMYWVEHLEVMDYTRSSVNLRAYGQRDPLVEYKKEGLRLFKEMQEAMRIQIVKILPHVVPTVNGTATNSNNGNEVNGGNNNEGNRNQTAVDKSIQADLKEVHENAQIIGAGDGTNDSVTVKKEQGPGRNDPCPCGSGKKYKKCCGK
ncbi:MAG: preprotein translocase subunit SecA [Candidatus Paceibacterota bacterium]|jgi:preprotein translocase subunit SecA